MEKFKYYGHMYKGKGRSYNIEKCTPEFSDPFEALKNANELLNSSFDIQDSRLLVVIQRDGITPMEKTDKYAFFQFTNSKACEAFISNKSNINWSTKENEAGIWNGDHTIMT